MNTKPISLLAWTALVLLCGVFVGGLRGEMVRPVLASNPAQGSGSSEEPATMASSDVYIPAEYRHNAQAAAAASNSTLYFSPLDSNNHNTILFFYNTTAITSSISLAFKTDAGAACGGGIVFDLPPNASARFSADTLDAGRPASWSNTIIYNVLDTCEIGVLTMPSPGVQVEGYVAWTATDTYNPRELNPHAPVRFSTDPYTVNLPAVLRQP
jgi:hypothetical protein